MRPLTVGIAGTAKNTGKTTTLRMLLDYFQGRGVSLGITSIGYDGENVDNVTGLPKPRIHLKKGDLAAVAEKCLPASTARIKILERTGIITPLGRIVCGRVISEGLLVVAGPNQSAHLRLVRQWMEDQGAGLTVVDGALNRIAPMVETDGFILSTGAAKTTEIDRLALEARGIEVICNLPAGEAPVQSGGKSLVWGPSGGVMAYLPAFLYDPGPLAAVSGLFPEASGFYCPGVVSGQCLEYLRRVPFAKGFSFVFEDPVKVILGGDVAAARLFVEEVIRKGARIGYRRALPLMAVTVNPFYPGYRYETRDYQPAFVDRDLLLAGLRAAVDVPVFDVVRQGAEGLARVIESFTTESAAPDIH